MVRIGKYDVGHSFSARRVDNTFPGLGVPQRIRAILLKRDLPDAPHPQNHDNGRPSGDPAETVMEYAPADIVERQESEKKPCRLHIRGPAPAGTGENGLFFRFCSSNGRPS